MKRYFPRTFVKDGYTLVDIMETRSGETVALIDRNIRYYSYVVAWCYDKNDGTWGQGHYFDDKAAAVAYFKTYIQ